MKKTMKCLTAVLSVFTAMSAAGCRGRGGVKEEAGKTNIYVGYYNGGVGSEWLDSAIAKFEERYSSYSFETEKTGVKVHIEKNKTTMLGKNLIDKISTNNNEIFLTENVNYYKFVERNLLYDITDAAKQTLTEFGENTSVYAKMDGGLSSSLEVGGKIYALPFWEGFYGLTYNADLFEEYGWYFAEDGVSFTGDINRLSAGPDREAGTYDDGMPATYEDFFALLGRISKDECTPLVWGGASPDYLSFFIGSLFADYEGLDDFMLNYTMEGTADDLVKELKADGTYELESVEISENNAYELARQEGLLVALRFAQTLLKDRDNYDANLCLSDLKTQSDAQSDFVLNTSNSKAKKAAILLDGNWWENEATKYFNMIDPSGNGKTSVNFKYMPLPKANEKKTGSENLIVAPLDSFCFIKSNIKQNHAEAAVKFLQFIHTDAMMKEFTEITTLKKPYDYDLKDAVSGAGVSCYVKSVYEAMEKSTLVFPRSNVSTVVKGGNKFRLAELLLSKYSAGMAETPFPTIALIDADTTGHVADYTEMFEGIYTYRKTILWPTLL